MAELDEEESRALTRPRFFHGMFAKAEDWQAAHDYHVAMRWMHNRSMHTPGIVAGWSDELKVTASPRGDAIEVGTGMALDELGRELVLERSERVVVKLERSERDATLYIVARYREEPTGFREDRANPSLEGYTGARQSVRIDATWDKPDGSAVELARVRVSGKAPALLNPAQGGTPQANEIDRTHVRFAGARSPFSLRGSAQLIRSGEVNVPVAVEPEVLLETVAGDAHRFYIANVRPGDDGILSWEIQSRVTQDRPDGTAASLDYVLVFHNRGDRPTKGFYAVYRLPE